MWIYSCLQMIIKCWIVEGKLQGFSPFGIEPKQTRAYAVIRYNYLTFAISSFSIIFKCMILPSQYFLNSKKASV